MGSLRVRVIAGRTTSAASAPTPSPLSVLARARRRRRRALPSAARPDEQRGRGVLPRLRPRRVFVTDLGGGGLGRLGLRVHGPLVSRPPAHQRVQPHGVRATTQSAGARHPWRRRHVDVLACTPGRARRRCLFVGRLLPHKGVHDLIDALPAECRSASSGGARTPVLNAAAGARRGQVRHVPPRRGPTRGLVDEYRRASCVVLPSVYTTPDGENHARPRAPRADAARGDGVRTSGHLHRRRQHARGRRARRHRLRRPSRESAALGAAIGSVLADPAAADRMGARGRARVVEHFSWSKVVERCLAAYRAAIA